MIHMGSDHTCVMAHFVFPAAKQQDSHTKRKEEMIAPKTDFSSDLDNNKMSSELNTEFEEKYMELKRILVKKYMQ